MEIFDRIYQAVKNVFIEFIWDDMPIISKEAQEILSHPEDRKLYIDAIERLRNGSKEETITLHTGNTITLF